jgi:hypothetical protein
MRRKVRLTESDLHKIVKESVKKVLNEVEVERFTPYSEEEAKCNKSALYSDEHPYKQNPSYGMMMLIKKGWDEDSIREFFGGKTFDRYYGLYKNLVKQV